MPRAGGEADKLGNHYEAVWTANAVLDVFLGRHRAITVEALDDKSDGVEFHLDRPDGRLEIHSVKRQKQGGDWSLANLCKQDVATGRSILGDLFAKREKYNNVELRFVSATGANNLRELAERAEAPVNTTEFKNALSAELIADFGNRLVPLCKGNNDAALSALKSLEVILRSHRDLIRGVDQRIEGLFYRVDGSALKPSDVRSMVSEYIVGNLGKRLTTEDFRQHLRSSGLGLRDWKSDPTVLDTVRKTNSRYLSSIDVELINGAQIIRNESAQIVNEIIDHTSCGKLLVAPGGYGKSCVVSQCVAEFNSRSIPVLCIRMDSLQPCSTAKQLGQGIDLPASPAVVLAGIADNSPSVLVVDQLDAMSLVSGRHPKMWEVFSEIRDEVRAYPNMKMLVACRDFDLQHDHRLKSLSAINSGFTTTTLSKLTQPEIEDTLRVANLSHLKLNKRQIEILAVPFHLLLFLQGDPSKGFSSVSELYDRYWERKRLNVRERLGRDTYWTQIIEALSTKMSNDQVLIASRATVDQWATDAEAMISEHVLVEAQNRDQLRFFHESFFDYAYARQFCATGKSVVSFLSATEQHLFRRSQVRQILAYRRDHDFTNYISDLREIFDSPDIRFHIKRMIASGLHEINDPKPEEWAVVEPLLLDGDLSRSISSALRRHVGWFDLMDKLGVLTSWLASDDERLNNAAIWFFELPDIQDHRSARIAELVVPYIDRDGNWPARMRRVMSWGNSYKSAPMAKLDLELIKRGFYDDMKRSKHGTGDFWGQYHDAGKNAPKFMIDVAGTWMDRALEKFDDGKTPSFLDACDQNKSHYGTQLIGEAASLEPEYFVSQILPRVVDAVQKTEVRTDEEVLNRVWVRLSNYDDPFAGELQSHELSKRSPRSGFQAM